MQSFLGRSFILTAVRAGEGSLKITAWKKRPLFPRWAYYALAAPVRRFASRPQNDLALPPEGGVLRCYTDRSAGCSAS